jgi:asparagine synthase (glutamine-hydrolysing)
MCGIVGIFSSDFQEVTPELLERMTKTIRHRGPDDVGYVLVNTFTGRCEPRSGDDTIAELTGTIKPLSAPTEFTFDTVLCHRRLSIIDLSAAGHQPMSNEEGTVWIVHNGEVYNHAELREELKSRGHRFRSRTDTEVILHSYEEWGRECLCRFNGMWAFAIWDSRERKLFCSRDRFGIKPFYYYFDGKRLLIASEIKSLLEANFVARKPNDQTIFDYLVYGLEDCTEDTFFGGIRQLRGGHYLEFHPRENGFEIKRYYDVPLRHKLKGLSDDEYARRFRELLEDSIRLRLISDVPLGTCLSGGLDSSSIVCVIDKLMREKGLKLPGASHGQRTFSARFNEEAYDEGPFIDDVVKKTGVDAYYTRATGEGLWTTLPDLIWQQEEPFTLPYVYPQFAVYEFAKQSGVKVALDGQGADELLAGYGIYFAALFSYFMRTFQWKELVTERLYHSRRRAKAAGHDLLIAAYHLLPRDVRLWGRRVMKADGKPCLNKEFSTGFTGYHFRESLSRVRSNFFDEYLYERFANSILPGLLRDQDKNSMAHSIESRVPFLDYRLVEFVFSSPWEQKIHRATRKFILRSAMKEILPESVANRNAKMGFSAPVDLWFRTPLGDKVSEILNSQSFRERSFFDAREVQQEFKAHLNGQKNIGNIILRWLNLELWLRMFIDRPVAATT